MNNQIGHRLTIEITSFSYKRPLPPHLFSTDAGRHGGGFVFDCRCLPNPGREERFKSQTGRDVGVISYLESAPEVSLFREHAFSLVVSAVTNYLDRGFSFLSVGFGCTGGQHRSVFLTEVLARSIQSRFPEHVEVRVHHSNLDEEGRPKGV